MRRAAILSDSDSALRGETCTECKSEFPLQSNGLVFRLPCGHFTHPSCFDEARGTNLVVYCGDCYGRVDMRREGNAAILWSSSNGDGSDDVDDGLAEGSGKARWTTMTDAQTLRPVAPLATEPDVAGAAAADTRGAAIPAAGATGTVSTGAQARNKGKALETAVQMGRTVGPTAAPRIEQTSSSPRRSWREVVSSETDSTESTRAQISPPQLPEPVEHVAEKRTRHGPHGERDQNREEPHGPPTRPFPSVHSIAQLLEPYQLTEQQTSPTPAPRQPSPLPSDDESGDGSGRKKQRARFDESADAEAIAQALRVGKRRPDTKPLIEILPGLTHEEVMQLRAGYVRLAKVGANHKGANLADHIRTRLQDVEDRALMQACYAVALGKWESEAYWATVWCKGDRARHVLLVESLMGRTNEEIRHIKRGFHKASDGLGHFLRAEIREDMVRRAVMRVLEEQRMEETDPDGRALGVDGDWVRDDVEYLHTALTARHGGERIMIDIVVSRSDSHLREIQRLYKNIYRANFAREAMKKSNGLTVSCPSFCSLLCQCMRLYMRGILLPLAYPRCSC